jgi:Glutaminase
MEGSMRVFGLLFGILSLPLFASEITTQIQDIDYGQRTGDEVLVFLKSGHVAKLRESHDVLNASFMKSEEKNRWYKVTLDGERYITSLDVTDAPYKQEQTRNGSKIGLRLNAPMSYVPTTIASMDIAKKYHKEARYNPKDSQCFNRAMVWTYEWWRKNSLKSNKLLIYFTRTYIRRYNFEWWFHIAPYVHVMENGKVVERVMDIKYTKGPRNFQDWANIFLRNDAPCPMITKYSDYADYPYTGECFFQRTSMYTYQPADLQMNEAWGYTKENFNMTEVRQAYEEAFDETI